MAKTKKRVKARIAEKAGQAVNAKPIAAIPTDNFFATAYTLNIIATVIVLVTAILFLIFPAQLGGFSILPKAELVSLLGVLDIVIGLALLIAALFMKNNIRDSNTFVLVFSVLAIIFPPHGFFIGPLIGIITSIIVLAKIK
jgi:hypothetical protein